MVNAHKDALIAVQAATFGSFEAMDEIALRVPWGFHAAGCQNTHMDAFISREYAFRPTIALHILLGEGGHTEQVLEVLQKSVNECARLLVLEHNPAHQDWTDSEYVSEERLGVMEEFFTSRNLPYEKREIGNGRNLLYVVSTIAHLDWNSLSQQEHAASLDKRVPYSAEISSPIYAHTSEDFRRPSQLLDDEIVQFIQAPLHTLYSVVGGMMVLDVLSQCCPSKLHLFDQSFKQALYVCVVINIILESPTVEEFDTVISAGISDEVLSNKLDVLWPTSELNTQLQSAPYMPWGSNSRHWRNLLKIGEWRTKYGVVRDALKASLQAVTVCRLCDLDIKEELAAFYVSTIPGQDLPCNSEHMFITANADRDGHVDYLELFNGRFRPFGASKKGRDTPRVAVRASSRWKLATALINLENMYSTGAPLAPRRTVSPHDPRTPAQLAIGAMRGEDRMLLNGYAYEYARHLPRVLNTNDDIVVEVGILKGVGLAVLADLFPGSPVYGFDIDLSYAEENRASLEAKGAFSSNEVEVLEYDQFVDNSLYLKKILNGRKIKCVVDDGFHSDETSLMTLHSFHEHLADNFVYFLEDNHTAHTEIASKYPQFSVHRTARVPGLTTLTRRDV